MSVSAWPFLVSRNRTIGYTTVVAPQFINEAHVAGILAQAAGGEIPDPNRVLYREVDGSKVGDLTIVFRIVQADQRDIGLSGSDLLRDDVGRPIRLIEGIVFREHVPDVAITRENLQIAYECVRGAYKIFWETVDLPFSVHSSQPFVLHGSDTLGDDQLVHLEKVSSFRLPSNKDPFLIPKGTEKKEEESPFSILMRRYFEKCKTLIALIGRLAFPIPLSPRPRIEPRPSPPRPLRQIGTVLGVLLLSITLVLGGWFLVRSTHPIPSPSLPIALCIGTDFSTSGAEAIAGIPLRNGADLAIIQNHDLSPGYTLNACDKNDVSPITGIHDPNTGVQNINELINNKAVLGLVGSGNSTVAQAEIPIAAQAGLPMVSPNTTVLCLTLQQYCTNPGQVHPPGVSNSFFRICGNDLQQGQADADLLFRSLGLRTAFVVDDTEVYGQELADAFTQYLANDGGTVLGRDHISKGNIPAQLVQEIVSVKPDAVFYGGTTSNGGGRLKAQLVQAGFTGPLIGGDGIAYNQQFLNDAGPAANNTYAVALGPDPSTLSQSFTQAYQNYYGTMPSPNGAAISYDAAMVLITAIRNLIKTNPQVMHGDVETMRRAVLEKVQHPEQPYHGLTGTITFDSNGDNAATQIFSVQAVENRQWIYKPEHTVT